ncbi:hypothetical protein quinque_005038 [Culex quinquefasciatus]
MQKVIALLVIVAVSSSLQSPVETGSQTELQSEVESAAEAVPQPNFVIPFFTANWYKSVEYCNYLGLRLAVIDSKEKEASLYAAVMDSDVYSDGSNLVWVGASDLADEGSFHWHGTGRRVVYSNWADRQPDNGEKIEHCVEAGLHEYYRLSMKWQWNDRDCKVNRYFVCEKY